MSQQTHENKVVRVRFKNTIFGAYANDEYHKEIEKHTAEGWRLLQCFAPPISAYGHAKFVDLIFERKV